MAMASEYFFGVTLSKENKELKWEPDELKENGSADISLTPRGEHCLIIKQAVIVGGVEGEVNVIEAETSGYKATVKIPVAALMGGKATNILLDLNFPDPPVSLRLIEGSGPVHITGVHAIQTDQYNDDDDDDEDDYLEDIEEDDDDEDEGEAEATKGKDEKSAGGKRRANSNSGNSAKKKKGSKEDA